MGKCTFDMHLFGQNATERKQMSVEDKFVGASDERIYFVRDIRHMHRVILALKIFLVVFMTVGVHQIHLTG